MCQCQEMRQMKRGENDAMFTCTIDASSNNIQANTADLYFILIL